MLRMMKFHISSKWLVLLSLWAARLVRQPTDLVRVQSGLLRGSISYDGTFAEYLGIPYAAVDKRFQPSHPVPPWEGILEAKDEHLRCKQRFSSSLIQGEEDCLTLNVYTPLPSDDVTLKPVMVFIHGGGFRDGSGSPAIYGPDYLIKHDVILVTVNYRLEILGFLCLGIEEAPGNMGLKDQVEGLKWVRDNIKVFGGDPDHVTIFGESAGASSVAYHLLSPMSRGLFHQAILQSGSALSPWSFQFEPRETAMKFVENMGYSAKDPDEIVKILRDKTADELLNTRVSRRQGDVVLSENIFVPCIEKPLAGQDNFLSELPYDLISTGRYTKVPMILGYNNAEGYMFIGKENDTTIENFSFYGALPRDLKFPSDKEAIETADKLKQMYVGDRKVSKQTIKELARFEGDQGITYSVVSTIEMMLKTSNKPIFTYKFSYDGWMNLVKILYAYKVKGAKGAAHADELFYIFKTRITFFNSFLEMDMIKKVSSFWANFAKYGDPAPEQKAGLPKWRATDKKDPRLLVIDKKFSTTPLWDDDIILFWNKTYSKYRRRK